MIPRRKCRDCKHRHHGHGRCTAKCCKCWPPIDVDEVYHKYTGRVRKFGEMRVDLMDTSFEGGYFELTDLDGDRVQMGSFATFLGGLGLFRKWRLKRLKEG